jgi:hypothetical protein
MQVDLVAGQTMMIGARTELGEPELSADGIVTKEPEDILVLFETSPDAGAMASDMVETKTRLQPIPENQGALVADNYIGEDLVLSIDGILYTVPANGRLQINLAPGMVSYSASAGVSGTNADVLITKGEYSGLGFSREIPPEADYDVGDPGPVPVSVSVTVNQVDLSSEISQMSGASEEGAAGEEDTGGMDGMDGTMETEEESTSETSTPAMSESARPELTIINYAGKALTFTINNEEYVIAEGDGELTLNLDQGTYGYTASIPGASTGGDLELLDGDQIRLSLSSNVDGTVLTSYIE